MKTGYIYKITNKINNKIYIGQTIRDPEIRFDEHLYETRGHSRLHNAIQKYGRQNFYYEIIEQPEISQLDTREQYWISFYNSTNDDIGYNICYGGSGVKIWSHVQVIENNIIFDSKEEMARKIQELTSWKMRFLSTKLKKCLENGTDFLGYHLKSVNCSDEYLTDNDIIEDWIKKINTIYCGKYIHCEELNKDFETIGQAAKFLLDNGYYKGDSKMPIQSIRTAIGYNLAGKTDTVACVGNLSFYEIPGQTTKNTGGNNLFEKKPIHCIELNKDFPSSSEAAEYFINENIWTGIKLKTAKLRISDVLNGVQEKYKGYSFTFIKKEVY